MIPNMFTKAKIPDKLPKEMEDFVKKLKRSKSKKECIRKAYSLLTKKYRGLRLRTYTRFLELFTSDVNKILAKNGFLHCNVMNYMLRVLLVKSGLFKDGDIELRWTLVWYFSPHQYLKVWLNKKEYVYVDLWGHDHEIKLGDYARGFHGCKSTSHY